MYTLLASNDDSQTCTTTGQCILSAEKCTESNALWEKSSNKEDLALLLYLLNIWFKVVGSILTQTVSSTYQNSLSESCLIWFPVTPPYLCLDNNIWVVINFQMCTYENWPKSTKCAMCGTIHNSQRSPASSLIISSLDKEPNLNQDDRFKEYIFGK